MQPLSRWKSRPDVSPPVGNWIGNMTTALRNGNKLDQARVTSLAGQVTIQFIEDSARAVLACGSAQAESSYALRQAYGGARAANIASRDP